MYPPPPFLPACLWSHVFIALLHLRRRFIDHPGWVEASACGDQRNLISLLTLCRGERGHRSAPLCNVRESTRRTSSFILLSVVAQSQLNLDTSKRPVRAGENCLPPHARQRHMGSPKRTFQRLCNEACSPVMFVRAKL